jgi:hypothetical protein
MKGRGSAPSVRTVPSVSWPTPYMGSTITLRVGLANGLQIDQRLDRIDILIGEVLALDNAGLERHIELQLDHIAGE